MTRSIWKISKGFNIKKTIKNCWDGNILIKNEHLNKIFKLYNGNEFFLISINEDKLKFKIGEFIRRRNFFGHDKKKKK